MKLNLSYTREMTELENLRFFDCKRSTLEPYSCIKCNFESNTYLQLKKHNNKQHLTGLNKINYSSDYTLRSYTCAKCFFVTHSILQWLKHEGCLFSTNEITPSRKPQDIQEFDKSAKILECIDHGSLFKWKQNLKNRIGVKHSDEKPVRRISPKKFKCGDCDSTYKYKGVLLRHIKIKHGVNEDQKSLECEYCGFQTSWKPSLKRHLAKHVYDKDKKWFQCDRCIFKTANAQNLKEHYCAKHADRKWFDCDQCAFKTKSKQNLKTHVSGKHTPHEDIKWLYCEHCPFKTKYKSALNIHSAKGICEEMKKWLHCDKCTFKTLWKCSLNKHYEENHIDYTLPSYYCAKSSVETDSSLQWTKSDECLSSKDEMDPNRKEQDTQDSNKSAKILECIDRGSLFKWKQNLKNRINVYIQRISSPTH